MEDEKVDKEGQSNFFKKIHTNTMYTKLLQSTIPSSKKKFPSKYEYVYSMPCYKFIAALHREKQGKTIDYVWMKDPVPGLKFKISTVIWKFQPNEAMIRCSFRKLGIKFKIKP